MNESKLKEGISIVIPSFRPNHYLSRLLSSIEAQEDLPENFLEVIIVINGKEAFDVTSVAKEVEILSTKHIVRVLYNSIGSVSKARNIGIDASSREFITFCDDDDWIGSRYLCELYKVANNQSIACAPMINVSIDGESFNKNINTFLDESRADKLEAYSRVITISACKLLPTKTVKQIYFDEHLLSGEDVVYFSSYMSKFSPKLVNVKNENSFYYRYVTEKSVSRQPVSFDFNVDQRLDVIQRLVQSSSKEIDWYQRIINGQLSFVNKYYANHPESENRIKGAFNKRGLGRLMSSHNNTFSINLRGK